MTPAIIIFGILFAYLTWRNIHHGLVLLFALLPTYLIRFRIGPIPSTVLELMILIIAGITFVQYRKKLFETFAIIWKRHPSHIIAIFLFILSATISIFTSVEMRAALGEWRAFYIEPIILALVIGTTVKTKKQINYILFALILSGLVTSLLAIYQHFTGWMVPYDFWENRNTYRVTAWYGFPNGVGIFLAPLVPLAIYLTKTYWKKTIGIISLVSIPLFILATLYAKSTGALIGIMGAIGLLLLFWNKTRWFAVTVGLIGIVGLLLLPANNPIRQEVLFQDRSAQLRLDMWSETTAFLKDHPITGAGIASYEERIEPYRQDRTIEIFHHPHNLLLTMWVNLGLFGAIAFVWIVFGFFWAQFTAYKTFGHIQFVNYFLVAALVAILIMGIVDSPYIKNDWAALFWTIPSLMFASALAHEKLEKQKS